MKPRAWITLVVNDTHLSGDARLLLCWLGSRPAAWRYCVDDCMAACGWGRQKFQKVLREVKAAGWIAMAYKRDSLGRIIFTDLKVKDRGSRKAENQPYGEASEGGSRKPDFKAAGPRAENQPRLKNSLTKKETQPRAALWNRVTHTGSVGNA